MSNPKNSVRVVPGMLFDKKNNQITDLASALDEQAKCGCGISICDCELVLRKSDGTAVTLNGDQLELLLGLLD
jgi:hypothetical protein